jgi:enoyl-CoA hydratase
VVAPDVLTTFTLDLASRIAEKPLFALKLAKEAVNVAQDNQGRLNAMQTSFAYHQLCHSHNQQVYGALIDPAFVAATFSREGSRG